MKIQIVNKNGRLGTCGQDQIEMMKAAGWQIGKVFVEAQKEVQKEVAPKKAAEVEKVVFEEPKVAKEKQEKKEKQE